jgi:hypothetical protein
MREGASPKAGVERFPSSYVAGRAFALALPPTMLSYQGTAPTVVPYRWLLPNGTSAAGVAGCGHPSPAGTGVERRDTPGNRPHTG